MCFSDKPIYKVTGFLSIELYHQKFSRDELTSCKLEYLLTCYS